MGTQSREPDLPPGAIKARARSAVVRAQRIVCWPGACARACGDRNFSPARQPQRMPLSNRPKQLSN
eukprot:149599-Prymnesium_polylepis.1